VRGEEGFFKVILLRYFITNAPWLAELLDKNKISRKKGPFFGLKRDFEALFGVGRLDAGRVELSVAGAARRLFLAGSRRRPHDVVGSRGRLLPCAHICARCERDLAKPFPELPRVCHQPKKIHGDHEGTDEGHNEGFHFYADLVARARAISPVVNKYTMESALVVTFRLLRQRSFFEYSTPAHICQVHCYQFDYVNAPWLPELHDKNKIS
jgi:hypothetical protein